ncbi:MAG: AI-2E family transporter [Candidatus Dormibacteria bacterium]
MTESLPPLPPAVSSGRRAMRNVGIFLAVVLALMAVILFFLRDLLGVVVISIFAAFLVTQLVDRLEARGVPRTVSILLVYAVMLALLVIGLYYLVPAVAGELNAMTQQSGTLLTQLTAYVDAHPTTRIAGFTIDLRQLIPVSLASDNVSGELQRLFTGPLGSGLVGITIAALNTVFQGMLTLIVTFLLVKDVARISAFVKSLVPVDYRHDVSGLVAQLRHMLAGYLRGQGIICGIIAVLTAVMAQVLGLNYALALGVIAGLAAIVPFIGPFLGAVPALIFAFAVSPLKALVVGIAYLVINNLVLNFVTPKVVGDAVNLHPLIIIVAFIVGFSAGGIVGMFIAVPMAAAIKILFTFFHQRVYERVPTVVEVDGQA